MKNLLLTLLLPALFCGGVYAQDPADRTAPGGGSEPQLTAVSNNPTAEKVVTFRFVPGDDMFYIPWSGNDGQLTALYALVDEYRADITAGHMPIHVDGY